MEQRQGVFILLLHLHMSSEWAKVVRTCISNGTGHLLKEAFVSRLAWECLRILLEELKNNVVPPCSSSIWFDSGTSGIKWMDGKTGIDGLLPPPLQIVLFTCWTHFFCKESNYFENDNIAGILIQLSKNTTVSLLLPNKDHIKFIL